LLIPMSVAMAFSSCQNSAGNIDQPPPTVYAPPAVQPLKLSKPVKINWDSIKAVPVYPVVKPFDLDKLPAQSYDTAGFKPFKYPVDEAKLDINALPEKDLDIDKLPSHPLKFTTEKLPPPKLIHAGPPHLKDLNLSLFELGEAQGLMGNIVSCLFTDRDGFLWIGTDKGLYRYDGENLLFYIPVTSPYYIFSMLQDTHGRIWLTITNGGDLEILDTGNGTLEKADRSSGLSGIAIGAIFQDKQQRVWVPAASHLSIIDIKTQTFKRLDKVHGIADTITFTITQDNNQNIWVSTNKGVNIIDFKNKKIKYLNKSNGLSSDSVLRLFSDRAGRVWVGLNDGLLNIIDLQKNSIQTIKEAQHPNGVMLSIFQDKPGKMWVGPLGYGLEIMDPENRMAKDMKKINGLNGDVILNVNQDNQDQVWIGAWTGLNMISANSAVTERIGKAQVNYLAADSLGFEWDEIVKKNGVDLIDRKNKKIRHLGVTQGLMNDTLGSVYEINGRIFMPTAAGLDIINPTGKTITHIKTEQRTNKKLGFSSAADKAGRIWMTETGGLCVYDPKLNILKHLGKAEGFLAGDVDNMKADTRGRIWFSTYSGGIFVIDPFTYTVQNINNNVQGFKNNTNQPPCFLDDRNGNMWIGTYKGIYIANVENQKLTAFSFAQGLVDDRVASLLLCNDKIYVSTLEGITIISPPATGAVENKKWSTQSFGKAYGLEKVNPDYSGTDAISLDGHFLWGDYGVTILDLNKKDTTRPPAYITSMSIMDQPARFLGRSHTVLNGIALDGVSGPSNMPVNLQLPHDQNYVQFNFSTLNFVAHDTTWYTYKLVGKDTGWNAKTTLDHSRNYFSLPPGKYMFEVASKSSDNGWSKPASFSFIINPPWWQTWWAYTIYVVVFFGTIWGFVTLRSRQLVKEKRILEHKVHVRTEEVIQQKEEIEAQRDNLEKSFKELKNAQTQLIQSEKMASLGELTAGIAHEIQNPLNFVNNFSEVNTELIDELQQGIDNGNYDEVKAIAGDIKENQQKISQHGKRADFIVKGMLLHSRNNSGERQLTNINVLADEFFKLSYHGLRAKDKSFNAEMTTHFGENLPAITVVQQDIGRVLLNLFNNAFYATNQKAKTAGAFYKPEVLVSTTSENGQVIIKVKDNGVGIPDTIKEKIMQPFFTTKPTGEGTGLGLSLTYDMVVKGHGGSIQVNSKEGEGSEFVILLPVS